MPMAAALAECRHPINAAESVSYVAHSECAKGIDTDITLVFLGWLIGIVSGIGIEHGLVDSLIVVDRIQEALGLHISVVVPGEAVGRHDALHRLVIVVDFFLHVAVSIYRVAPLIAFLDGEMAFKIE